MGQPLQSEIASNAYGSRSVYNKEECQLVVAICRLLLDSEVVPNAVGIITPYKAQERMIGRELHKR